MSTGKGRMSGGVGPFGPFATAKGDKRDGCLERRVAFLIHNDKHSGIGAERSLF